MNIEERVNRSERKIETVEDAIKLLSQLIANHDERLYDSSKGREDLDEKITMLIDAQIRSEDKLHLQSEDLNAKIAAFYEAQTKNEENSKIQSEELNAKMTAYFEAQIRSENKIQNINQALDKLTELVNKSHQRLDRLES